VATQLFFTTVTPDWSRGEGDADLAGTVRNWSQRGLSTSRGSAVTSATRTSVAGPTPGIEAGTTLEWVSDPLDADVTISGNITANLWGSEGANANNSGFGCIIQRLNSQGAVVSTIMDNTEVGVELTTSVAVRNEAATPTSTNMLKGDRLRVRVYFNDAVTVTMGAGGALTFRYAGTTAAVDGDSYITFTETFGFLTTAPSGSVLFLTDTASAVDPNGATHDAREAWTSRGSGSTTRTTAAVAGPTVPLLARLAAGSTNFQEWFTKQLTGFTLSGLVSCNIWGAEGNAAINASIRCEIAVCDSDGTNPVVWGAANDGTELVISIAAMTFNVAGDDTTVTDGQRLRIRVYFDDAPGLAMTSGNDLFLYYGAASAGVTGDTYIVLPQTVTEFVVSAVESAQFHVANRSIYPGPTTD
jgi:hypothetical protein